MKKSRITILVCTIMCASVCFGGCQKKEAKIDEKQTTDSIQETDIKADTSEQQGFTLKVSKEQHADFNIPDPITSRGNVEVVLPDIESIDDFEEEPQFHLDCLGLEGDFHVKCYETGNVTGNGEDLILELELLEENSNLPATESIKVAVLNYTAHTAYITDLYEMHSGEDIILLKDITGDDINEIYVETTPNTYPAWSLVGFKENELTELYNSLDERCAERFNDYEVMMMDDYTVKIWGGYDLKEKIDLRDLGYEESELEYYKDGELICDEDEIFTRVWPETSNQIDKEEISAQNGLHYTFPISVAINSRGDFEHIGYVSVTLKYSERFGIYEDEEIFVPIKKGENSYYY